MTRYRVLKRTDKDEWVVQWRRWYWPFWTHVKRAIGYDGAQTIRIFDSYDDATGYIWWDNKKKSYPVWKEVHSE